MSNKQNTPLMELREKIEKQKSEYWDRLCPLSAFDEVAGNLASQISTIDIILTSLDQLVIKENEMLSEKSKDIEDLKKDKDLESIITEIVYVKGLYDNKRYTNAELSLNKLSEQIKDYIGL